MDWPVEGNDGYRFVMIPALAFVGFGEAGAAFAVRPGALAFDLKLLHPATRPAKEEEIRAAGACSCTSMAAALTAAEVVVSVVTADQAVAAAEASIGVLQPGALWLDMNSVAPETKRVAAEAVRRAGGRYADVAVMAPVLPARCAVPLLVSGPCRDEAVSALRAIGFEAVSPVGERVGEASAIKMIRSVMVKGIEALSAECALAADAAGVLDAVIASLDASWPGADWRCRFDYHLDRMMVHGGRRAAEMEEASATLAALGIEPVMTRGTVARQRALGVLHLAPPEGLETKLATLARRATLIGKVRAA